MELLVTYIEKLLIEHDCVIVPDLGGFVLQHEPAQIQEGRIIPPHATIGFNSKLTHADGLLVSEYAVANDMPYRQAAVCVQHAVARLQATLQQEGIVRLGRLGTLAANADGILDFMPGDNSFLPDNFGLAPLYFKPLPVTRHRQITLSVPLRPMWYKYAAACALAVFLMVSPKMKETATLDYAGLNPVNWSVVLAEKERAEQAEREAAIADSIFQAECTETQEVLHQERDKYHIIVAALEKQAANDYCMSLLDEGFPCAHIFPFKNGLYYVAVQSFQSKREALKEMQQLRKTNPKHDRAWVLCQ